MTIAMVRHVLTAVVAAGLLTVLPGVGHAQFVLYDDFSSGVIGPGRWSGSSTEGPFNAPSTEFIRVVDNGSLHLSIVSWGDTASDAGSVVSNLGLNIRQLGTPGGSGFIIGLKAKFTVLNAQVQDCLANTSGGGNARFRWAGKFFNDGAGGPNNQTGDIMAFFNMQKDTDGVNRIIPLVFRCANATCSNPPLLSLTGNGVPFAMGWSLNHPVILKLVWDQVNGKFTFSATDVATLTQESRAIVYLGTVTDAGPPIGDFKNVAVAQNVENCTSARKAGVVDALIDNVKLLRQP